MATADGTSWEDLAAFDGKYSVGTGSSFFKLIVPNRTYIPVRRVSMCKVVDVYYVEQGPIPTDTNICQ